MTAPSPDALSAALERVLARFGERVRRVGSRYRLAGDDLDELLQQVRLRLWQAQEGPDTIEAVPASYVYRTAVTAALDLIRRKQARREVTIDATDVIETNERLQAPATDAALEESELGAIVSAAIDCIVESRRPVVRMYLAGYRPDEIAATFGWTAVKTRNLLYRGLTDLRGELEARGITSAEGQWIG